MTRQAKYRESLATQLKQRQMAQAVEHSQRHNMTERQILEENAKKFEQKEHERALDEKLRGMSIMD